MKLIIRDPRLEKPEEIIDVWLEKQGEMVCVMSSKGGNKRIEVNLHPDLSLTAISNGNFKEMRDC